MAVDVVTKVGTVVLRTLVMNAPTLAPTLRYLGKEETVRVVAHNKGLGNFRQQVNKINLETAQRIRLSGRVDESIDFTNFGEYLEELLQNLYHSSPLSEDREWIASSKLEEEIAKNIGTKFNAVEGELEKNRIWDEINKVIFHQAHHDLTIVPFITHLIVELSEHKPDLINQLKEEFLASERGTVVFTEPSGYAALSVLKKYYAEGNSAVRAMIDDLNEKKDIMKSNGKRYAGTIEGIIKGKALKAKKITPAFLIQGNEVFINFGSNKGSSITGASGRFKSDLEWVLTSNFSSDDKLIALAGLDGTLDASLQEALKAY